MMHTCSCAARQDGWSSMEDCREDCDHGNRARLRQMEEDERYVREEDERQMMQQEAMSHARTCKSCKQIHFPKSESAGTCEACTELYAMYEDEACFSEHEALHPNVGYFVDVVSSRRYEEGEYTDRQGKSLIGCDDRVAWWGTDDAAWMLSDQYYTVQVVGFLGTLDYTGHFIATVEEALDYCTSRGVTVKEVMSGE